MSATVGENSGRPREDGGAPVLLAGGNPQIPNGNGDVPVVAYLAGMPGWKGGVGCRLDELIMRTVPRLRKAVRGTRPSTASTAGVVPIYHCLTRSVRLTFFRGVALELLPPGSGKDPAARWTDLHEGQFEPEQLAIWIHQVAVLHGWRGF